MKRTLANALAAIILLVMASPVFAQTSRGTVTGIVTDPQGAVIQGATAELKNIGTNQTRTVTTNDSGLYRFDAVDLGIYDLKISSQGFKAHTSKGIEIQANRVATFDALLETGGTEVIVEVNAGTEEILQKSDAVRGGNFNFKELSKISLPNQNPYEITRLLPGVILPTGTTNFGNFGSSGFSINGSRPRGNNYLLDGTENNDISVTGPAFSLQNEDAVAEVSLQTGIFSAEFGRAGGGVFNQVTKSGTNQFHGTARELYFTQAFNALTNGNRISNLTKPPVFTDNVFGGAFGGPIRKDKTFFFASALWDRFRSTANFAGFLVPTANGLGRLRQLFPAGSNPRLDLYLSAYSGLVGVSNPSQIALGAAPGSTVDRGSIEFGGIGIPSAQISNGRQFTGRVDHTISEAHRLTFRYLFDDSITTPSNISNPGFIQDFNGRSQNFLATHTWILGPTLTNEFRFSFGRINFNFPISPSSVPEAFTLAAVNIQGISGYGIATNIPQFRIANNYLAQETMSKVYKSHTFRFGGEYLRQIARQRPPFVERGVFNFLTTGGFTGFANYIDNFSGFRSTANRNFGDPVYRPNLDRISLFFQDTWKATQNLTLTLGLRYENFGQPANNAFGFPAINLDPATFLTPNKVDKDNNNFGPVIGFAWTPRFKSGVLGLLFREEKTVWRGGYQVSFDTFFNNLLSNIAADSPNSLSTTFVDASTGTAGTSRGTANFFPGTLPTVSRIPNALDSQTSLFNPNIRNPYTQRFSLELQRQLPGKVVVDVAYVGSLGRKLFLTEDVNPFVAPGVRRFPLLGIRRMRTNGANSFYNSLQVRVDKAFSHGFQFISSYTLSRNIDNISEVFATSNSGSSLASVPVYQGGLALDRALSDFDRRHVFTTGYVWELPGPKNGFLGQVAGGWQLGGSIVFQSGAPYTLLNGSDRNGDGVVGLDRPDIGNSNAPRNTRALINATCSTGFSNPDAGNACVSRNDVYVVQGTGFPTANTIGRNTERSKAVQNFSTSVFKTFNLTERFKLEYRFETFNLFNHPQFAGIPGQSVAGSAANRYQRFDLLNGGGRTARMGLKFIF